MRGYLSPRTADNPADAYRIQRACFGKKRYGTMEHAQSGAAHLRQRTGDDVHGYECPHCFGFHVGGRLPNDPKRLRL